MIRMTILITIFFTNIYAQARNFDVSADVTVQDGITIIWYPEIISNNKTRLLIALKGDQFSPEEMDFMANHFCKQLGANRVIGIGATPMTDAEKAKQLVTIVSSDMYEHALGSETQRITSINCK